MLGFLLGVGLIVVGRMVLTRVNTAQVAVLAPAGRSSLVDQVHICDHGLLIVQVRPVTCRVSEMSRVCVGVDAHSVAFVHVHDPAGLWLVSLSVILSWVHVFFSDDNVVDVIVVVGLVFDLDFRVSLVSFFRIVSLLRLWLWFGFR